MHVYYLCMAGDTSCEWDSTTNDYKFKNGGGRAGKCEAITLAKDWDKLLGDPLASGQRWYCPACGARYATAFGLLMEMKIGGGEGGHKILYARVKFPDTRGLDMKALFIQFGKDKPLPKGQQAAAAAKEHSSPEELFNSLPRRRPLGEGQSLVALEGKDSTFRPNGFSWAEFEMEESSLYFTTVLSKQHRKIMKTNFEKLQTEQDAQRAAQETRADEIMDPDWEGVGFKG